MTLRPYIMRHWFVNSRGAINVEFVSGSNEAEVSIRERGRPPITRRFAILKNDGHSTDGRLPDMTENWKAIADIAFMSGASGWKFETERL